MKKFWLIGLAAVSVLLVSAVFFSGDEVRPISNYPSNGKDMIAFGDSLVEGVGATEGGDFVSLLSKKIGQPIINLGRAGDTTADGAARLEEFDRYKPKVVLLLLGGNDFLRRVPLEETRQNLSRIIENIQKRGGVVLLLGVRGRLITNRANAEFETLRDKYRTAYVSDVLEGLFGNGKYMADQIHPNNAGYEIIAERIYPVLNKLIK